MKIYIIDDDINVIKMLENIIEDNSLGDIVGYQTNSEKVINELLILKPDIIILDFLMPKIDGRQLIIKMKANLISSNFIMLSKVTDKDMIGDIYDLGIEFFINKPINNKEIVSILNNVIQKIKLKQKVSNIEKIITNNSLSISNKSYKKRLESILLNLGIAGEKGTYDIINILDYTLTNQCQHRINDLDNLLIELGYNPKIIKQRMRRSMNNALNNLAYEGVEDFYSEHFVRYSKSLFDFQSVRKQMDYIQNKQSKCGSVNIKKFLIGLTLEI
jgi:two-component system response regulator YcbB